MKLGNIEIRLRIIENFFSLKTRLKIYSKIDFLKLIFSSDFIRIRSDSSYIFAKNFYNYFNKLTDKEKKEKIEILKNNLDQNSCDEIDRFLARQKHYYTHSIINHTKLFTETELSEQIIASQEIKNVHKKIKKFKLSHDMIESFYGQNGLRWLNDNTKEKIKNGVFFDIGAYEGDSSITFLYNFNPSKIYAFEPEEENFQKLKQTKKILNNDKLEIIKKGISNYNKTERISKKGSASQIHSQGKEKIQLTTIDNFIKEKNIKKIDVIKMDIEGEESNAIAGAINTIKTHKPVLLISIYHNPKDFFEIKPLLEKLVPEYKFIIKKINPFSLNVEIMLLAYI